MDNEFVDISIISEPKYHIITVIIKTPVATPMQWEMFKGSLTKSINIMKTQTDLPFAFLFNLNYMGLIGIPRIKDFISILKQNGDFIEDRCISTSVLMNKSAVKILISLFLRFYQTKKPLFLLNTIQECTDKIKEIYLHNCKGNDLEFSVEEFEEQLNK